MMNFTIKLLSYRILIFHFFLKVVKEKTKLPGRMVGVNALSLFGVTSHAVIEQNQK